MIIETTIKSIAAVRQKSDSCILFCSLGKDSLVLLDMLYPRFDRVVCVFMYFVKGLDHIERWVGWLRAKYPRVEFVQVPHWNLTYILRSGMYCVPNPNVKLLKLADVVKAMRTKYGIEYVFLGMKKADGMNRNLMLKGYEQHVSAGRLDAEGHLGLHAPEEAAAASPVLSEGIQRRRIQPRLLPVAEG